MGGHPLQPPRCDARFVDDHSEHLARSTSPGGLTAELFSLFWREVFDSEVGLFETAAEGGAALPRPDADPKLLEAVGLCITKCALPLQLPPW